MGEQYHDSIFWVEVDRIQPNPFQPRREFDEFKLQDLADSIRQYGVLQPLVVTRKEIERPDGGLQVEYELIAGERRLRASKLANVAQVPVIIRAHEDSDQMKLELAIIENLQRDDLNAIDRARAFQRLADEFKLKHIEIGKKVGRSREYVSNSLRLLSLPDEIQQLVAEGKLSEGHTRPVLRLNDKPEEQQVLVKEIMLKKLTVREAESIAQRVTHEKNRKSTLINPELIEIERELTESLGTRVQIEPREVGGKVVINYFSADDLQSLLSIMQVTKDVPSAIAEAESKYDDPNAPPMDTKRHVGDRTAYAAMSGTGLASSLAGEAGTSGDGVEMDRDEERVMINDVPEAEEEALLDREVEEPELYSIRNFSI